MIMAAAKGNGKQGQQTEKWSLFGTKTVEKTANGKKKVVVKVRLAAGGLCEHVCMKDDESVERGIMAHSPWLTVLNHVWVVALIGQEHQGQGARAEAEAGGGRAECQVPAAIRAAR